MNQSEWENANKQSIATAIRPFVPRVGLNWSKIAAERLISGVACRPRRHVLRTRRACRLVCCISETKMSIALTPPIRSPHRPTSIAKAHHVPLRSQVCGRRRSLVMGVCWNVNVGDSDLCAWMTVSRNKLWTCCNTKHCERCLTIISRPR